MATALLAGCQQAGVAPTRTDSTSSVTSSSVESAQTRSLPLPDGRTARLRSLGGPRTQPLLDRIAAELGDAAAAVTAFWGPDWPRDIVVVATETDQQFRVLGFDGPDIAAATTADGIVFAPGAAAMSPASLRIVVRHELFHYAARAHTAADAPRWLAEGVADFVGRPPAPLPGPAAAAALARLPTDADLDSVGEARSAAYDRAWWFARYVATRYGAATLKRLYLRASEPGHPDVADAVRDTLGADLDQVLAGWRNWMSG
ncbi:peptidase [Mycolicibacterium sp. 120266]|uniref:peptidase n=1 Tax=Mycolicibacterium sp. 120266 TaxID=3090601 RepID=UPI00299E0059|nr:peptidase [Mycolicibacterium sp. 120266]MDX1873497.1 peptidase [Mycolicibacterium sp. 120266]